MTTLELQTRRHDARAIANYFLDLAARDGEAIDHLKLQKLVYFAHGWHLAVTGEPLIWQDVLAWPYGPVIRQIYDEFREYGRGVIDGRAVHFDPDRGECLPYTAAVDSVSSDILSRVWEVYKNYSGLQLSAMAHAKGTPWDQVVGHLPLDQRRDKLIPNEIIRQHYVRLAKERQGIKR